MDRLTKIALLQTIIETAENYVDTEQLTYGEEYHVYKIADLLKDAINDKLNDEIKRVQQELDELDKPGLND